MKPSDIVKKNVERILTQNRVLAREPINQVSLAKKMGIKIQSLNRTLKGIGGMNLDTLNGLADGLGVDPSALLDPDLVKTGSSHGIEECARRVYEYVSSEVRTAHVAESKAHYKVKKSP